MDWERNFRSNPDVSRGGGGGRAFDMPGRLSLHRVQFAVCITERTYMRLANQRRKYEPIETNNERREPKENLRIEHIFALVTSGICGRAIPLTQPGATVQSQSIVGDTTHRPTLFIGYISSEGAGGDSKFLRNLGCAMPPESHLDRTSHLHRKSVFVNKGCIFVNESPNKISGSASPKLSS